MLCQISYPHLKSVRHAVNLLDGEGGGCTWSFGSSRHYLLWPVLNIMQRRYNCQPCHHHPLQLPPAHSSALVWVATPRMASNNKSSLKKRQMGDDKHSNLLLVVITSTRKDAIKSRKTKKHKTTASVWPEAASMYLLLCSVMIQNSRVLEHAFQRQWAFKWCSQKKDKIQKKQIF